jgi:hypothetical protein
MDTSEPPPVWILTDDQCGQVLHLDPATGLPAALGRGARTVTVYSQVELITSGAEERAPLGGLTYPGAIATATAAVLGHPEPAGSADHRRWTVPTRQAGWLVDWTYRSHPQGPGWSVSARLRPTSSAPPLRGLSVRFTVRVPDAPRWRLDAPGNRLRPDVALADLTRPIGISTLTGLRGSPGIICFTAPDASHSLLIWPDSVDELSHVRLAPGPAGPTITIDTGVAAAADAAVDVPLAVAQLGLRDQGWANHRTHLADWYAALGIRLPEDRPPWTAQATIFEAQIGFSVFGSDGWEYRPYPTAADLLADLPRIRDLGFDTIQLMPRQPYPSYNVHDYADITTSYGDEEVLAQLVRTAHERGMRVILDVILHGVLDRESIDQAVAGVLAGPYADRINEATDEINSMDPLDTDAQAITWSRHILDFAGYWRAGAPKRHPLCDEHPQWFCTDSQGRFTGIYTKAFDLSNPEWQRYFTDAMVMLVRRLDIDGFRFDAPTYNAFASWSPATRRRASAPTTAAIGLFRAIRDRLKTIRADLMMYTEPSGPALRQSMDLNYNYDEQWLIPAVMTPATDREPWLVSCATELAAWLAERDRTLPPGGATAHHIDSHDTFWWPLPGTKWRREQYGTAATRALLSVFALSGGAFMSFVGGETGIEDHLRRINLLRRHRPEIQHGAADFDAVEVDQRSVFAVVRRTADRPPALVLVNLSPQPVRAHIVIRDWPVGPLADLLAADPRTVAAVALPHATTTTGPRAGRAHLTASIDAYETLVLTPADS